jgi:hypothetical protein
MPLPKATTLCLLALALGAACSRRESPEDSRARSVQVFLRDQIAGLEKLIGQVERGEVTTTDLLAIGVSEDLASGLLNASLPLETVVAERLRIRVDSAVPLFRGSRAALVFRTTVSSVRLPGASASLEIGGALESFELAEGRLRARVKLAHFAVRESGLGDLAADAIEKLVRANATTFQDAIPALEIPVHLEEAISIGGLTEGPVVARPGSLPLNVGVSQLIVGNRRLWVLLKAEAGPWQPAASPAPPAEKAQ